MSSSDSRCFDSTSAGTRLDDLRVVVADDDRDALELATAILTGAGALVRTCTSAPQALAAVEEWRPDVLVSDIEIPDEDGYELIGKVRTLDADRGGRTPAIALTAYGRTQDPVQSLRFQHARPEAGRSWRAPHDRASVAGHSLG